MEETRARAETDEQRRRQLRRRAKRGLVAGYIHELSARHRTTGRDAERRADRPLRPLSR
jgi:hypothetical protein